MLCTFPQELVDAVASATAADEGWVHKWVHKSVPNSTISPEQQHLTTM